jgi:hypothetical protein
VDRRAPPLTGKELPVPRDPIHRDQRPRRPRGADKQALNAKHLVFDIRRRHGSQYRQALRECTELILPISISASTSSTVSTPAYNQVETRQLELVIALKEAREQDFLRSEIERIRGESVGLGFSTDELDQLLHATGWQNQP